MSKMSNILVTATPLVPKGLRSDTRSIINFEFVLTQSPSGEDLVMGSALVGAAWVAHHLEGGRVEAAY